MKVILSLIILISATSVYAQKRYITGIQKVTFRSGPGKTNKIIKMIETESAVSILESGEEWTKVKDSEGTEGFILNRFLAKEVPYSLRYKWLKGQFDKLKDKNADLQGQLKEVNSELSTTKNTLNTTQTSLDNTSKSFEELKTGSQEYLSLKQKYEKTLATLNSQNNKVVELKSRVSTTLILWFLAGGGVFLVGWLIGLFSRKRRKYASSIRL